MDTSSPFPRLSWQQPRRQQPCEQQPCEQQLCEQHLGKQQHGGQQQGEQHPREQHPGGQQRGEQHPSEQQRGEQHPGGQQRGEQQHGGQQQGEQHPSGQQHSGQQRGEQHPGGQHPGGQHPGGQHPGAHGTSGGAGQGPAGGGGGQKGGPDGSATSGTNPYAGLVSRLRASWLAGKTRPLEQRVAQLEALGRFLEEKKEEILEATALDMRKPPFEAYFSEYLLCKNELNDTLNNLCCWMKDEHVEKNLVTQLDSAFIRKDPYGVVLIIAPWNYPIHLFLVPLIGAIAAGNCVIVKPSETTKNTEKLVAEVLPCYLDKDCYAVVTAGVEETTKLLENKFDYIFFTGSPSVGRIIMTAAAKHLTPVTLELGGKNPCYVSDTCDVRNVARRVAWGRFFNAGQTCIAPDYVLCSVEMQDKLMPALREAITEFYGPNPKESPDFARIVGDKQFRRIQALLGSGRVAIGGQTDERERYIAPTVLADVKPSDPAMQEEIFGPVLPIVVVANVEEAIDFINARPRPLALYVFSCDNKVVNQVLEQTSSGGFCGNDTLMHVTLTSLPFGGIGNSGLGKYHGRFTFDTFTHHRSCLHRNMGLEAINCPRYPPYSAQKLGLLTAAFEIKRKGMCTLL